MVIHGGEGLQQLPEANVASLFGTDGNLSSTVTLADIEKDVKPQYRISQPLDGIMPGDNIQPSRFGTNATVSSSSLHLDSN